jgi:hypothetical protein
LNPHNGIRIEITRLRFYGGRFLRKAKTSYYTDGLHSRAKQPLGVSPSPKISLARTSALLTTEAASCKRIRRGFLKNKQQPDMEKVVKHRKPLRKVRTYKLTDELYAAAQKKAKKDGQPLSNTVEKWVTEYASEVPQLRPKPAKNKSNKPKPEEYDAAD